MHTDASYQLFFIKTNDWILLLWFLSIGWYSSFLCEYITFWDKKPQLFKINQEHKSIKLAYRGYNDIGPCDFRLRGECEHYVWKRYSREAISIRICCDQYNHFWDSCCTITCLIHCEILSIVGFVFVLLHSCQSATFLHLCYQQLS